MKIITEDGRPYTGKTASDCLSALFDASRQWTGDKDLASYLEGFAKRVRGLHPMGHELDLTTHETFVNSAAKIGVLTLVLTGE